MPRSEDIRFYRDADSGLAHCYVEHNIHEREVIQVLRRPTEVFRKHDDGTLVAEGRTTEGRYLRIIYRDNQDFGYTFVITAYDLNAKAKRAHRRRRKRK